MLYQIIDYIPVDLKLSGVTATWNSRLKNKKISAWDLISEHYIKYKIHSSTQSNGLNITVECCVI